MTRHKLVLIILSIFILYLPIKAQNNEGQLLFKGRMLDAQTKGRLGFATIQLKSAQQKTYYTVTDDEGGFFFDRIPISEYEIIVSFVGYKELKMNLSLRKDTFLLLSLVPDINMLDEVLITASESTGITSASKIDRQAMKHLQPSSFTDLLTLLPGGMSSTPRMGQANSIRLREVGNSSSNYDISSLGTAFVVDGLPLSMNANMQRVAQATSGNSGEYDTNRNYTNKGVDMRTLSTDNIESVEVIRGIPSVEYGDLTSGVIVINRKLKQTPWEARFKADQYGKLFYVGKGIEIKEKEFIVNAGLDYLDSKSDPRNNLVNYKRLTGSVRTQKTWHPLNSLLKWRLNLDYTGSFDNEKNDPEVIRLKDDRYKSSYNRMMLSNSMILELPRHYLMKSLNFDVSTSLELDKIEQTRFIALDRDHPVSDSNEEGEHDGLYLPYKYLADIVVDGKPFHAFAKAKGNFNFSTFKVLHKGIVGVEWRMDKNYGKGQVYDASRPLSPGSALRPRDYSDIPAGHQLSLFAEDAINIPVKSHRLKLTGGLRGMMLLNLDKRYYMQNRLFFDPRVNAQWIFPGIDIGEKQLSISLSGGVGWQTKFPTLLQLYPDKYYNDVVQLNYFNLNPDYRRLNLKTFIMDRTNYGLRPARNRKWEVRLGMEYNGNSLSVTYFRESLNSGFRNMEICSPFIYKKYDDKAIDPSVLQGPPALEDVPFRIDTILNSYSKPSNGSRLLKEGVEFQFSSRRFQALKTRITINGAWFRTTYSNSQSTFSSNVANVVNNVPVNRKYVGYYDWIDGSDRERFNTNFMADTYLKKLGLTFSVTMECQWYYSARTIEKNGTPVGYMDVTGQLHPFTDVDATDMYKQWLVQTFNPQIFDKTTEPFYFYVNFKVTKDFGKYLTLALFVDRILDYMPDYTSNGQTVRRNVKPYFGMELNFNL